MSGPERWAALVLAATFGWLLTGCATAGDGDSDCRSELRPHAVAMADVLDSVSLQGRLARIWTREFGTVLGLISYDSAGALEAASVLGRAPPPGNGERLDSILSEVAAPTLAPNESIELFIGDASGPRAYRVMGFRACPPTVLNRDSVRQQLARAGRDLRLTGPRRVVLDVFVRSDGSVGEIRVAESSGSVAIDQAASEVFRAAEYVPQRVEGIDLSTWTRIPVTLAPPAPG
jgi:TonB family protein